MGEIVTQEPQGEGLTQEQAELLDAISSWSIEQEPQDMVVEVGGAQKIGTGAQKIGSEGAGHVNAGSLAKAERSEAVQAAAKARRAARIKVSLAQKALVAIEDLVTSPKTPAATRFSAAKWILEQAGHREGQDGTGDKPIAEMTEGELLAFVQRTERAIAEGGKPPVIKVTP